MGADWPDTDLLDGEEAARRVGVPSPQLDGERRGDVGDRRQRVGIGEREPARTCPWVGPTVEVNDGDGAAGPPVVGDGGVRGW